MLAARVVILIVFFMQGQLALAGNLLETLTGKDVNQSEFLRNQGISFGGWLALGSTLRAENPQHHNNSPITFNDRSTELQVNQLNLFLQKAIDVEAKHWNFGGKLEFMFGTDSRFTQAKGLDDQWLNQHDSRFYDVALPQAYVEVFAPFGNGLSAKIGHFYTLIGQEVVPAPNNFFYSHSYVMQYGEPFTHTGIVFNYALNDNFTVHAGAVTGWDNFDKQPENWHFLGNLSWASDDAGTSVAWSVISGTANQQRGANQSLSSLVITHNFGDQLHYTFQHDAAVQEASMDRPQNAYWYGINQYWVYDLNKELSLGLRTEWFRDNNGTRLPVKLAGNVYAITAGLNWQALDWLKFRPELRYDWTDSKINIYDQQSRQAQLQIAMDVIVTF